MFQILVAGHGSGRDEAVERLLLQHGFSVTAAGGADLVMEQVKTRYIDLLLLDERGGEMDGCALTKALRANGHVLPVFVVTDRDSPRTRCEALLAGADDCLAGSVDEEELLLRIKSLLRRSRCVSERRIDLGDVALDFETRTVTRRGTVWALPKKEFQILYRLLSDPERIYTRLQLKDEIWGKEASPVENTINTHISRLRRRFAGCPEFSIETVRWLGYKAEKHV